MCFKALPVTGQGDVHEVFIVTKILEGAGDAALVIVPPEAEVLCVDHVECVAFKVFETCVRIWKTTRDQHITNTDLTHY